METNGKFYLGRMFDPGRGRATNEPLLMDPADLTTHAVVVGMTGSGKTGLCIGLLEEAALNALPALMIDPKGDITNSLLHFPSLAPEEFLPWVNPDQARREGLTVEEAAAQAAASWRAGLAEWGMGPERVQALKDAVGFTVYTPGSTSGVPVSILASFKAPALSWDIHREILREKIAGTVTALLGLVGLTAVDPVRSREHILLANIFENAWSQGQDMDLGELILQTQNPPFDRLGVFDVNTFFPEKDRFELAMRLNNMLAAPAFQTWIEGDPLDIQAMLYLPDGRPRHNIFYIAHLSEAERMFFITLLYSAVETWMRTQPGSPLLQLLLYFDEIFGYLPPVSNPPSKQPMLRMLKQARAFGVGQVLVTQNPVDLDYKALSNAGAWFIGKLQTEQDKARLLDGLSAAAAGGLDRRAYDQLISALGKRVFLLHNVHGQQPVLFQTRWAMNYLPGPLTRVQIPLLNQLLGAGSIQPDAPGTVHPPTEAPQPAPLQPPPLDQFQAIPLAEAPSRLIPSGEKTREPGTATRPTAPTGIGEFFLPHNLTLREAFKDAGRVFPVQTFTQTLLYRPRLLAQAHVRFTERKYDLDHELILSALMDNADRRSMARWEQYAINPLDPDQLESAPALEARFTPLETPFTDGRVLKSLEKDFLDWVYRTARVMIRAHPELGVFAGPDISQAEFRRLCAEQARQRRDVELARLATDYDKKFEALEVRLERELRELETDQTELSQRRMEEIGTHAEYIFSLFSKRKRRLSTSLTKHRLTSQAKADVKESRKTIASFKKRIELLEAEEAQEIERIHQYWASLAADTSEIAVPPYRKNIFIDLFGIAWMPCYVVETGSEILELPGFSAALASAQDID
jgi:hypothetical protein